ncbi:MAG: hypothetical protein ACK53V_22785, partial [Planctomycetota bacterium]
VEIAVGNLRDITAAHRAKISFITLCHQHTLPSAHFAISTLCHQHTLPSAHTAISTHPKRGESEFRKFADYSPRTSAIV